VIDEIPVREIDFDLVRHDHRSFYGVVAASFVGITAVLYTGSHVEFYRDDDEVTEWLSQQWELRGAQQNVRQRIGEIHIVKADQSVVHAPSGSEVRPRTGGSLAPGRRIATRDSVQLAKSLRSAGNSFGGISLVRSASPTGFTCQCGSHKPQATH
jgi:hypothetical protein